MLIPNLKSAMKRLGALIVAAAFATGCAEAESRVPTLELVGADGTIDWSVYYTTEQAHRIMRELEALHPELVRLETIGTSYLGQDLLVAEVTNRATGPAAEKPAMYVDGGIHAAELTGSYVALYFMAHLLNNHGSDPRITELLETRAFYIHPKFNPDGSDRVILYDEPRRSTVRPVDLNEDGIPDSDPPEDLTGNGRILQMRVPDPNGRFTIDPADSRIMRERQREDTGPFYTLVQEGVDRNGDGIINSDGFGGIDMNRNWPRNWERWHLQGGSGDYPLSEPETRWVAQYLNERRNIGIIFHGHTPGGFIYRLPSAMDPAEFDPNDEALVIHLGEWYTADTGRRVIPSATHATERRYGTLIQWAYSDFGAIGYVPEFSPGPNEWVPDYEGKGYVDVADWHRYNDEEFGGRYFSDWEPYDHPQLGSVEIGGWWTLFWGQNPPNELLERELETQLPWMLYLAEQMPRIEVASSVEPLGGDRFAVDVTVRNTGFLPTNVTERGLVGDEREDGSVRFQVTRSPLVVLYVDGGAVVDGYHRRRIPHLAGTSPYSVGVSDREHTIRFEVERGSQNTTYEVTVHGEKAGTARTERRPL